MQRSPFVLGLASVFAGLAVLLTIGTIVSGELIGLIVAVPFGATSYVMYYHGSGKLAQRVYQHNQARRRDDTRDGFGAGPRERTGNRTRAQRQARTASGGSTQGRGKRTSTDRPRSAPTRKEARRILGVDIGADESDIREAYRERVKDVHPDRGGNESEFKQVTAAYERLTE